jgi:hypothetical protein
VVYSEERAKEDPVLKNKKFLILVSSLFLSSNLITANAMPLTNAAVTNSNVKALFTAIASSDPDKVSIAQKYISQNSSADLALTMIQNSLSSDKYWRSLKPFSVAPSGIVVTNPAKGSAKFSKNSISLKTPVTAFSGVYSNFKLDSKGKVKSWSVSKSASGTKLSLDSIIFSLSGVAENATRAEEIEFRNGTAYQSTNGNTYIQTVLKNTSGSPKSIYFTGGVYRSADGKKSNATTLPGGCFAHDQVVVIDASLSGKSNIIKNTQGVLELPLNSICNAPWHETRLELRLTAN